MTLDRPEDLIFKKLHTQNFSQVLVRIASEETEDYNNLLFCRIDFENCPVCPKLHYDYGGFKLVQLNLGIEEGIDLLKRIKEIGMGFLTIGDSNYNINSKAAMNHYFIPSGRAYALIQAEWPTDYFSVGFGGGRSISWEELPQRVGLPPYPNKTQAILDFMDIRGDIVQLSPEIIVTLPNYRARIKKLSILGNEMVVEVDANDYSNLAAKFYCMNGNEKRVFSNDIGVVNGVATFKTTFEPDTIQARLIDTKLNEGIDMKGFGRWHSEQKGIYYQTPMEKIGELILAGETQNIEFKAEVSNNSKYELLETVVSFANTKGGTIIVGVDDKNNPKGFFGDKQDILKTVAGLIRYHCDPKIEHSVEWRDYNDFPLLLIHIPEGKDKPYMVKERGIYIRDKDKDYLVDRRQLDEIYRRRSGS